MERKRPHKWPCVCQDCCVPWDPTKEHVSETPVTRALEKSKDVDDGMPMAEFCREIMRIACKATGKTEEQLRSMAAQIGSPFERKIVVEPAPHWTEEDEREPGEEG